MKKSGRQAGAVGHGARVAGVVASACLVVGCAYSGFHAPPPARTLGSANAVVTYGRSLQYDTTGLTGDKRRLSDTTGHNTGPLAEIQPMLGAHNQDTNDLTAGRVIARIVVRAAGFIPGPYGKFRIATPADTAYWLVQGHQSYFVLSTDVGVLPAGQPLQYNDHTAQKAWGANWAQSIARWRWALAGDEQAWVSCTRMGCCIADPN